MTPNPFDFDERSPLVELQLDTPVLQHQGRIFAERLSEGDEAALLQRGGLADLSNLPRFGLRGPAAAGHLQGQGYVLPERPNQALRQATGEWLLRLSQSEYLLLGALADGGARVAALEAAAADLGPGCYPLPRQDSHAWLILTGTQLPALFAKLCGVDLGKPFAVGQVVQTSVARLNAILLNAGDGALPHVHLLCDRASAHYLWCVLLDALEEFDGGALGGAALLAAGIP
ncbi:sarcosine oxidase [Pseudomonas oryzihabitans]|uniref:sarcosine oxidase n=1 Tax=Pseudomonas oryzihabitans TaxID=47885 RepID=UPI00241E5EA4|nr:sarcosine oxidase [Pseudomonas oryzihabitans]